MRTMETIEIIINFFGERSLGKRNISELNIISISEIVYSVFIASANSNTVNTITKTSGIFFCLKPKTTSGYKSVQEYTKVKPPMFCQLKLTAVES